MIKKKPHPRPDHSLFFRLVGGIRQAKEDDHTIVQKETFWMKVKRIFNHIFRRTVEHKKIDTGYTFVYKGKRYRVKAVVKHSMEDEKMDGLVFTGMYMLALWDGVLRTMEEIESIVLNDEWKTFIAICYNPSKPLGGEKIVFYDRLLSGDEVDAVVERGKKKIRRLALETVLVWEVNRD
jgi:hypothetical protein